MYKINILKCLMYIGLDQAMLTKQIQKIKIFSFILDRRNSHWPIENVEFNKYFDPYS